MSKEVDATWKNIKIQMKQLKVLIDEAENEIDNAIDSMHAAGNLWKEISAFLEIRKEYEAGSDKASSIDDIECNVDQIDGYVASIESEVSNLKENIKQARKES